MTRGLLRYTRRGASLAVLVLIGIGLSPQSFAQEKRFHFTGEAGVRFEDNVTLAPWSNDKIDDTSALLKGGVSFDAFTQGSTQLTFSGDLFYQGYDDLDDLSNYGVEFGALLRGEFGPEFTDPWYSLNVAATIIEHDDSEIRDGWWWRFDATLGKRFSQAFGLSGGYRYFRRYQDKDQPEGWWPGWDSDEVYDQERNAGFLRADFFVGTKTNLFAEYNYASGDIDASGRRFTWCNCPRAWDPSVGPGYIVWRIDADQNIFEFGVDHGFTDRFSGGLTLMYMSASGEKNNDYENAAITGKVSVSL